MVNGLRKNINKGGLSSAFSIFLIYVMRKILYRFISSLVIGGLLLAAGFILIGTLVYGYLYGTTPKHALICIGLLLFESSLFYAVGKPIYKLAIKGCKKITGYKEEKNEIEN